MPASGVCTPTLVSAESTAPPRQEDVYAAAKLAARSGFVDPDGVICPEAIREALERVVEARRKAQAEDDAQAAA